MPGPKVQYLYTVRVIDASRIDGYREETMLGYSHLLDELTLTIMIDPPVSKQYYNYRWVLGYNRREVTYTEGSPLLIG